MYKLFLVSAVFAFCCLVLYMLFENIYFDSVGSADAGRWKERRDKVAMVGKLAASVAAASVVGMLLQVLNLISMGGARI